jgi:hypothetical protein
VGAVGIEAATRGQRSATIFGGLLATFVFRVGAQLWQLLWPTPILPPFEAWHSATLPYPALVASQLGIIAVGLWVTVGMMRGTLKANRTASQSLLWIGSVYLIGATIRFIAGLTLLRDIPFFAAHVPAFFHIVLASMVIVVANFLLGDPKSIPDDSDIVSARRL